MLPRVLILYSGGTFGMVLGNQKGQLSVQKLSNHFLEKKTRDRVPELAEIARCDIEILLNRDSAHIGPDEWLLFSHFIQSRWDKYDGVVLLHGTDTLAYTASALSFLLRPCLKPVILTGAQKPLASIRTDARRNLISAVEIAASGPRPLTNQVSIFFDDRLLQGNQTRKISASDFLAFDTPKSRPLALVGTEICFETHLTSKIKSKSSIKLLPNFSRKVALLHLTPGFPSESIEKCLLSNIEGLVLVIFPSGTATTHDPAFLRLLQEARTRRIPVVTVTEDSSHSGKPSLSAYAAGTPLLDAGCYWADQMTPECAYVKTAHILAQKDGKKNFARYWRTNLANEGVVY